MVLSIPGREGTVAREWSMPGIVGVTSAQVDDILTACSSAVLDWLLTTGAQQEMF